MSHSNIPHICNICDIWSPLQRARSANPWYSRHLQVTSIHISRKRGLIQETNGRRSLAVITTHSCSMRLLRSLLGLYLILNIHNVLIDIVLIVLVAAIGQASYVVVVINHLLLLLCFLKHLGVLLLLLGGALLLVLLIVQDPV